VSITDLDKLDLNDNLIMGPTQRVMFRHPQKYYLSQKLSNSVENNHPIAFTKVQSEPTTHNIGRFTSGKFPKYCNTVDNAFKKWNY
jgi:hypothetical protein